MKKTEKTRKILETVAAQNDTTPQNVEHEMMEAIKAGMASSDPHSQALWKQIASDGNVPSLDTFLAFIANRVDMMMGEQQSQK